MKKFLFLVILSSFCLVVISFAQTSKSDGAKIEICKHFNHDADVVTAMPVVIRYESGKITLVFANYPLKGEKFSYFKLARPPNN